MDWIFWGMIEKKKKTQQPPQKSTYFEYCPGKWDNWLLIVIYKEAWAEIHHWVKTWM